MYVHYQHYNAGHDIEIRMLGWPRNKEILAHRVSVHGCARNTKVTGLSNEKMPTEHHNRNRTVGVLLPRCVRKPRHGRRIGDVVLSIVPFVVTFYKYSMRLWNESALANTLWVQTKSNTVYKYNTTQMTQCCKLRTHISMCSTKCTHIRRATHAGWSRVINNQRRVTCTKRADVIIKKCSEIVGFWSIVVQYLCVCLQ